MRDLVVTSLLVVGFAALVTIHLATIVGLARRHVGWKALVATIVPGLAPYWAAKNGMRARAIAWAGAAALYATALVLAMK